MPKKINMQLGRTSTMYQASPVKGQALVQNDVEEIPQNNSQEGNTSDERIGKRLNKKGVPEENPSNENDGGPSDSEFDSECDSESDEESEEYLEDDLDANQDHQTNESNGANDAQEGAETSGELVLKSTLKHLEAIHTKNHAFILGKIAIGREWTGPMTM